ncbi:pseudouridine synthase [Arachidicoccus sp.]|jgi:23S rRNA pseudouridine2605 synthase|uniref:pseudouridine synthase n=1 Tax=Arachidicoccus sp. TaxID=1872624 RepID=UPI003D1D4875
MGKEAFDKYINPKSNAKVKEEYRQEKRKAKAEMRKAGNEMRRIKAEKLRGEKPDELPFGGKNKFGKPYNRPDGYYRKQNKTVGAAPTNTAHPLDLKSAASKTKNYGVKNERFVEEKKGSSEAMPLNKFIAHAGICGRREAAELVKEGFAQVNGDVVFEPAFKVSEKDTIKLKGKKLELQRKLVYILMNKPKDHITTTKDEKGRKTVIDLLKGVDTDRVYPVGRLDRNTTGVLLLTNDGELAQKLTHPSFQIKKIYEASLDKPLAKKDAEAIATGLVLEDGEIKADAIGYTDAKDKSIVGIEIHSGKNRIVRRIFEHLGYEVKKLDRVMFANLTKKNVDRGKWRYMAEKEIRLLKHMNASQTKNAQNVTRTDETNGAKDYTKEVKYRTNTKKTKETKITRDTKEVNYRANTKKTKETKRPIANKKVVTKRAIRKEKL